MGSHSRARTSVGKKDESKSSRPATISESRSFPFSSPIFHVLKTTLLLTKTKNQCAELIQRDRLDVAGGKTQPQTKTTYLPSLVDSSHASTFNFLTRALSILVIFQTLGEVCGQDGVRSASVCCTLHEDCLADISFCV